MYMKKARLLLILTMLAMLQLHGQHDTNFFHSREFRQGENVLQYRILYPEGYKKGDKKKYPLVIFLHGRGESGSDNESQLKYGSSLFLNPENRQKYPAIVIFPQCPDDDSWATYTIDAATGKFSIPFNPKQTHASSMVQSLIKYYLKSGSVDAKRVYIMGLSMGGMGTLDLVVRNPKMFAAAVSICGAIEPARLRKLKKMPIRLYHGADDSVVPVSFSRDAFYELKAAGSSVVEITEYPGVGHNSWDSAFGSGDFLEWLFSFKR